MQIWFAQVWMRQFFIPLILKLILSSTLDFHKNESIIIQSSNMISHPHGSLKSSGCQIASQKRSAEETWSQVRG